MTRATYFFLGGILLLALSQEITWALITPLFQAPDEAQHLLMTTMLDNYGLGFYRQHPAYIWSSYRNSLSFTQDYYHQNPVIADLRMQSPYQTGQRWAAQELTQLHLTHFDQQKLIFVGHHAVYTYPPFYYFIIGKLLSLSRWLPITLITYQFSIRLWGILFYLAFIAAGFLLAHLMFPPQSRNIFMGLLLFHPMFTFMGAMANNDNALLPLSLLLFYFVALFFKQGLTRLHVALFALTLFALILTKNQGFLLGFITLCFLTLVTLWTKNYLNGLLGVLAIGLSGGIFALLPHFIGAFQLNGRPETMGLAEFLTQLQGEVGWTLVYGTLGLFGWAEIRFNPVPYHYFFYSCLLIISLTLVMGLKSSLYGFRDWQEKTVVFLMIVYLAYLLVGLLYQFVKLYTGQLGFFLQGRYFLSAFPIIYLAGVYWVNRFFADSSGQLKLMGWCLVYLTLGGLIYLNNLALYMVIDRFYMQPDIDTLETINRIMQYKPTWFKSDGVFWGLLLLFVSSQIGVIGFIFKDTFSLKINFTSHITLRLGYILLIVLVIGIKIVFFQQPFAPIYWTITPVPETTITQYVAEFEQYPFEIQQQYLHLAKSIKVNTPTEAKALFRDFLQKKLRRVTGRSKLAWLGQPSPLIVDVEAQVATNLAATLNQIAPYWTIKSVKGFSNEYQMFGSHLGHTVQINHEQQPFTYLPVQVTPTPNENKQYVMIADKWVEIGSGQHKTQRFNTLNHYGFFMPPAEVVAEFEQHGFTWAGYDESYLVPTLFVKK